MPVKSSFFILLITCFFCMHACYARRSRLTNSNFSKKFPSDKFIQIGEKLKFNMDFSPNERSTNGNRSHVRKTISSKRKEAETVPCKKTNGFKGENSGSEDCDRSAHFKPKLNAATPKGSRRGRFDVKEKRMHSSIFSYEDLLETDYQPPQRKSPIHN